MAQYVIQIQAEENGIGVGWLAKSFKVTEEYPIPTSWPQNRIQIVMTNTDSFNGIVAIYEQYKWPEVVFSYNEEQQTISSSGDHIQTWPID